MNPISTRPVSATRPVPAPRHDDANGTTPQQRETQPFWNRQRPSPMPTHRYRDVFSRVSVPLVDRAWPSATITEAPLWVPVDLRDGNQALPEPMDPGRKWRMFELMIDMGYTEIEVGYPSASQLDFDFVRQLAQGDRVPDHVTIVVFTPARADLIARTAESIRGLDNVVVHLYTATAPVWRDHVLGKGRDDLLRLISAGAESVLAAVADQPGVRFEFSPEVFNLTEPDFALDVCSTVTTIWDASAERPVIINLPATVEVATPNVYADQIEYMHRNLDRRSDVILSVHPHNDRGTGVACAELAVLAGAQRIEGCLFGNGERTGNVDLVTLALNLYSQGVDPRLDFSDMARIRSTVEECNRIAVHDRHPYGGDLVFTAFSGTHQDAIKKGFARHRREALEAGVAERSWPWEVPYLPIDPADLGRDYEAVVRVNSQSGKGGISHILFEDHGIDLPRALQIDFAKRVQAHSDSFGGEIDSDEILRLLFASYPIGGVPQSRAVVVSGEADSNVVEVDVDVDVDVDADDVANAITVVTAEDQVGDRQAIHYLQFSARAADRGTTDSTTWSIGFAETAVDARRAALVAAGRAGL